MALFLQAECIRSVYPVVAEDVFPITAMCCVSALQVKVRWQVFAHHFQAVTVFRTAIADSGIHSAWAQKACAHPGLLGSKHEAKLFSRAPKT